MPVTTQIQRRLLWLMILLVVASAAQAIWFLLTDFHSSFAGDMVATSVDLLAAVLLAMVGVQAWVKRRWMPVGPATVLAAVLACGLTLFEIWARQTWASIDGDWIVVAWTVAVALAIISILTGARLRRSDEWVRIITVAVTATLAGFIIAETLGNVLHGSDEAQILGTLAILLISGSVAVMVLHRIAGLSRREAVRTTELMLTLTCPRCNRSQTLPAGRSHCAGCGLKFSIEIEEEHCAKCGYPLYQLASNTCPECGTPFARTPADLPAAAAAPDG
ncbi:MAG: zinc ribbon domain-containing protein [Phycisphaerae bacterium]